MTARVLDAMDDVTAWVAHAPDGVTPSEELSIATDHTTAGWGADGVSVVVTASSLASDHRLQRDLSNVDLSGFTELRISVNVDAPRAGFLLEIRLASDDLGFDDAANTWHRWIPAGPARGWTLLTVGIDDVPTQIARAATGIRLRCLAGDFRLHLDDLVAVRPQPLVDADAAMLDLLRGVEVNGTPALSAIRVPAQPVPVAPAIDIEQFDIRYAAHRLVGTPVRCDYTSDGYRECRAGLPFDLDYALRPISLDRASQAELFEAVLARVPGDGELVINGDRAPIQLITMSGTDRIGGVVGDAPTLVYRVGVRSPAVRSQRVVRVDHIDVGVELRDAS